MDYVLRLNSSRPDLRRRQESSVVLRNLLLRGFLFRIRPRPGVVPGPHRSWFRPPMAFPGSARFIFPFSDSPASLLFGMELVDWKLCLLPRRSGQAGHLGKNLPQLDLRCGSVIFLGTACVGFSLHQPSPVVARRTWPQGLGTGGSRQQNPSAWNKANLIPKYQNLGLLGFFSCLSFGWR